MGAHSLTRSRDRRPARPPAYDLETGPPPEWRYRRRIHLWTAAQALWHARALVRSLAERDLRVRYKQAILGFAWSVINPIILLVLFTVVFEHAAHVKTGGVPYPLFAYVGLVPWTFFSSSVSNGGQGILADKSLLNKVHFPREAFPLADVGVALFDATLATLALIVLFLIEQFVPRATSYWAVVIIPIIVAFAVGVTLIFASLVVYFRDVVQLLPVVLQLGLFATPIAYSFSLVPAPLQPVYAIINPLGPAIAGLRSCLLYGHAPSALPLAVGAASAVLYCVGGYALFKRLEMGFADIA